MALKARIKNLDDIDAALHDLYTKQGDEYVLAVEGMVSKDKLDEFRDNNLSLKRQIDELSTKFGDVDPEKYRELVEKSNKERDKKLIDAGKVDELVAERTNAMKADFDKQSSTLASERAQLTAQLEKLVIDNGLRDVAAKAGVRPTAVEDVLLRGRSIYKLQDGKAVPLDGDKPIFGKSGDVMGMDEWIGTLADKAPHLFEPNKGANTPKGQHQGAGGEKSLNRESFGGLNPTAQHAFIKTGGVVVD